MKSQSQESSFLLLGTQSWPFSAIFIVVYPRARGKDLMTIEYENE